MSENLPERALNEPWQKNMSEPSKIELDFRGLLLDPSVFSSENRLYSARELARFCEAEKIEIGFPPTLRKIIEEEDFDTLSHLISRWMRWKKSQVQDWLRLWKLPRILKRFRDFKKEVILPPERKFAKSDLTNTLDKIAWELAENSKTHHFAVISFISSNRMFRLLSKVYVIQVHIIVGFAKSLRLGGIGGRVRDTVNSAMEKFRQSRPDAQRIGKFFMNKLIQLPPLRIANLNLGERVVNALLSIDPEPDKETMRE
jgi:hypothetical protein